MVYDKEKRNQRQRAAYFLKQKGICRREDGTYFIPARREGVPDAIDEKLLFGAEWPSRPLSLSKGRRDIDIELGDDPVHAVVALQGISILVLDGFLGARNLLYTLTSLEKSALSYSARRFYDIGLAKEWFARLEIHRTEDDVFMAVSSDAVIDLFELRDSPLVELKVATEYMYLR